MSRDDAAHSVDIAALAKVVRAHSSTTRLVVDNTFATPVLQRPLEQGATLVLHSGTKFLGGHGDVIAGIPIGIFKALPALCREHLPGEGWQSLGFLFEQGMD